VRRLTAPDPTLRLDPAGTTWAALAARAWDRADDRARRFRDQLGLPTDRPVILTGHQSELWHPGILAKWLAATAVARCVGGEAAWLKTDQAAHDPLTIRVPAITDAGALAAASHTFARTLDGVPTGLQPARSDIAIPAIDSPALPELPKRVDAIAGALRHASLTGSLSDQVVAAQRTLLGDLFDPPNTISALSLADTDLFRSIIDRLTADPARAARSYNAAVRAEPDAGVGELDVSSDRVELPLWVVVDGAPRRRADADDLAEGGRLAPRALLMTAMVRLAGCDLFIHGSGGAAYDRITDRWIAGWLGLDLGPVAMATADAPLPLPGADVDSADAARAVWRAHHARHDPATLDRPDLADAKRAMVSSIAAADRGSADRARLFHRMHDLLDGYRADAAEDLASLDEAAARTAQLAASRHVVTDRSWACALHDRATLDRLRDAVDRSTGRLSACA